MSTTKKVIISGSSRKNGNTNLIAKELSNTLNCEIIYLIDYKIGHYDYEHKNQDDDFIKLISEIISKYDTLIFATPVYWYSMSGLMKVFFDRFTDLITIQKDLGRKLRGKNMAVFTSSTGGNSEEQFWVPFKASAEYLGIHYKANAHTIAEKDNSEIIKKFAKTLSE